MNKTDDAYAALGRAMRGETRGAPSAFLPGAVDAAFQAMLSGGDPELAFGIATVMVRAEMQNRAYLDALEKVNALVEDVALLQAAIETALRSEPPAEEILRVVLAELAKRRGSC